MSEKIYACLLRLYPPAFRRRYEQETLQLLRDRLRDESGFIRRLRLGVDLLADMIGALPQAYRNSYAEVGTLTSVSHRVDNFPSFQSIRNEPIRRETFLVAGAMTLTVLVAFGYVMELPDPSSVREIGNRSAIESVLDRLNKQEPQDLSDSLRSKTFPSVPIVTGSLNSRGRSAGNLVPPPRTMPNLAAQILQPDEQIEDASRLAHASSLSPSTPPSRMAATRQTAQTLIGRVEPNVIRSRTAPLGAAPPGLSGRWTDLSAVSGQDHDSPRWFIFNQDGAELGGRAGSDSSHQYPIMNGSVGDGLVKFELSHRQMSFLYDLQVDRGQLRGTLVIRDANETRNLSVRLERVR